MKVVRIVLILGLLAASIAACTYADTPSEPRSTQAVSLSSPSTVPPAMPTTLQGKFQSQAAVTSGSATIRVTDTGAVLDLKDFSTAQGGDVRLMLSPGTLSPTNTGELGLSASMLIDLGPVSHAASQRVEMDTEMWSAMPATVKSVVIYNLSERTAYGTANLTDALG